MNKFVMFFLSLLIVGASFNASAHKHGHKHKTDHKGVEVKGDDKAQFGINTNNGITFRQLSDKMATPNSYHDASGAPGENYYQQQVDYSMDITLDEDSLTVTGFETITYQNNSPSTLKYLWLQLDQNVREMHSISDETSVSHYLSESTGTSAIERMEKEFDGGFKIKSVKSRSGSDLHYSINSTMMRIELDTPLKPNSSISLSIDWWYNINNYVEDGGRSGYEYFKEEDNYIFVIAQFFPRLCVYDNVEGWQHDQFFGRGEFALEFGNYDVSLTVPADHIVRATGELQNKTKVLTKVQQERLKEAKASYVEPVFIVTEGEARINETTKDKSYKTWEFRAENVRDFAFASSRKFIWDGMGVKFGNRTVLATSLYPKEGNPLWEQYSTKVVAHTLKVYSRYTFDYPYPVAASIHSARQGMEYPMICFNGGRPESDGTYSERTKYGMIGVVTHEVGHNFFPMIVNSDERRWGWMDEGLNSFLDGVAMREFDITSRWKGRSTGITSFMSSPKETLSPIMLHSDYNYNYGPNMYSKPATAMSILRETVLGRELFDYAFKEYANRWMFKHPVPEDLFRTMEDASATDLDWFWRGWFYSTDRVDIALEDVTIFRVGSPDPTERLERQKEEALAKFNSEISVQHDKEEGIIPYVERDDKLKDFYSTYDKYAVTSEIKEGAEKKLEKLSEEQKRLIGNGVDYYQLRVKNIGGLVMPVVVQFSFEDGSDEVFRIPVEVWRHNQSEFTKQFPISKKVKSITLDPYREIADIDASNNCWPKKVQIIELVPEKKRERPSQPNPMQAKS